MSTFSFGKLVIAVAYLDRGGIIEILGGVLHKLVKYGNLLLEVYMAT